MKKTTYGFSFLLLIGLSSCQKESEQSRQKLKSEIDQSKVSKLPETEDEKTLVINLEKVSSIFKELYKDNSNIKLVNAAIFSKLYPDQSILLKELINAPNSRLNNSEKFKSYTKKWNISLESFAKNFWNEANKTNDEGFIAFLKKVSDSHYNISSSSIRNFSENGNNGNGEPVSIYFPYNENFFVDNGDGTYYAPVTSIVTATADADEGWGSMPLYVNGVFQYYQQIIVNDDFAYNYPSHIIGVNGIESDYVLQPEVAPPPPVASPGVNRVYVGDGICKVQYDRLISFTGNGGGSEIKYCRLSGYLQPVNGQVTSFQDIVSANFSRKEIRNKNWKYLSAIWDADWVSTNLEQVFAIYEEDNTNTKTFNGSLGTTVTVVPGTTVNGSIGFSVSVQSQDDIIRQLKISRNSYFAGSFQDQGFGFSGNFTFLPLPKTVGWPIYDANPDFGANVGWTWPYNSYQ
ncbi:MAG TPA: hypothetical protein PL108_00685 [Sediminibacterium sp.]|mgnify:CR=1|jgi:hypothetical protein|nr:hypothetical protein [Sediminibacterium sp.]